jgi:crotonobetainyl-CoA:carnitine CoA-transferase CaiB-like acyl-CoA transferase
MAGALDGIRILDLSRFIAGPYCAMMLADMGAEVIKVEKSEIGDDSRHFPPFLEGESLFGLALNRNKRSMSLNFREPEAQRLLRDMVARADILIENFRPGTMEEMGCSWEALHALNPRLIMTRLSGFGQDGPYAKKPGFDGIAQAMSGLMAMTGAADGPPILGGAFYIDYIAAVYGCSATLAALFQRERSGVGQLVDVALLDSAVSLLTTALASHANLGLNVSRQGNRDKYSAPCNVFATASNEHVLLLSGTDPLFRRLAQTMDRPDLLNDQRFASIEARMINVDAIEAIVADWFKTRTTDDAITILEAAGIPCAKVATPADVVSNPQLRHRGQITEIHHPVAGTFITPGVTMKLSETPLTIRSAPPGLGEHTEAILSEWLSLSPAVVSELKQKRII